MTFAMLSEDPHAAEGRTIRGRRRITECKKAAMIPSILYPRLLCKYICRNVDIMAIGHVNSRNVQSQVLATKHNHQYHIIIGHRIAPPINIDSVELDSKEDDQS